MRSLRILLVVLFLGTQFTLARIAFAQNFHFVSIDVPCSNCTDGLAQTTAFGIGPGGDIVGTYTDAGGFQHGFLYRRGQFTTIDVPGALANTTGYLQTNARGISPTGDIVGSYVVPVSSATLSTPELYCPSSTPSYCTKGFLYRDGQFSVVLVPGHGGAIAQHITATGGIYGCLHDWDMNITMYGFALTRSGYITTMADGGAIADPTEFAQDSMINAATPDGSLSIGFYHDLTTNQHIGFVLQDGVLQPYSFPESTATNMWDINPAGSFVGIYRDNGGGIHGFLQPAGGLAPISIDYPGAVQTRAYGINPGGAIVGQYVDTGGNAHGFLAVPTDEE